ncbi:DUF192 domain-containing protein [Glaciimonas immobilis]|uniref:DUF192 domain-containing protein n=1 Tax=Glaciimonas immobilis TaxID=728004 RepID=A0A840S097_9BURK|nr:DUF192 domain-containing protein [Glaciimonas immobilis]KAF3998479.1 DUF192 domain-containing protein [Glaciimonas immobilis]MBB5202019.1 hypothetical protein [Glaciimonas immobilis]
MSRYRTLGTLAKFTAATLIASAFGLVSTASAQGTQQFPTTSLNAGIYVIKAEVATTEAQREQGLMFRKQLAPNAGMVFLFDAPAGVCMWMKNTLIPLSVAFLDKNGAIINIEEMKAQTLDSHCADKAALYALEMNPGWFKQKNLKAGTIISGLPQPQ